MVYNAYYISETGYTTAKLKIHQYFNITGFSQNRQNSAHRYCYVYNMFVHVHVIMMILKSSCTVVHCKYN